MALTVAPAFAATYESGVPVAQGASQAARGQIDLRGKAQFDRIIADAQRGRSGGGLAPIVRIVSPLADSAIAPGAALIGNGSFDGSGFTMNVEVVTRDGVNIDMRESTLAGNPAAPRFGIRDVARLEAGASNLDAPGFFVFFDQPLITPGGTVLPAFNNFAAAFNVSGTDDTPGPGITNWLGWHFLESVPTTATSLTATVAFRDLEGRVSYDQITMPIDRTRGRSGQALTPAPETLRHARSTVNNGSGPEVSLLAPRVPSSISRGVQALAGTPGGLTLDNGSLFFIHLSAVDRRGAGIALSENGLTTAGTSLTGFPTGLIFDPTQIGANGSLGGTNRNFPGMTLTFDVPLRQANNNVVPAGTNLAALFDVAGSEIDESGAIRITADWVVGGALLLPEGKTSVTISASVTDNAGNTGTAQHIVTISDVENGQNLTPTPAGRIR